MLAATYSEVTRKRVGKHFRVSVLEDRDRMTPSHKRIPRGWTKFVKLPLQSRRNWGASWNFARLYSFFLLFHQRHSSLFVFASGNPLLAVVFHLGDRWSKCSLGREARFYRLKRALRSLLIDDFWFLCSGRVCSPNLFSIGHEMIWHCFLYTSITVHLFGIVLSVGVGRLR